MALLIDYIVTVAVQVAAGTAAIASVFPVVGTYKVEISAGIILLMCYGNLRGLKEAGRAFAVPTYLFAGSVILMIIVGLIREVAGHLTPYDPHTLTNHYAIGAGDSALISGVMIFTLLRAFANGGASLTGIEAVSDAVGAFRPPEGRNARQVLVAEGCILGILVAGISWLAHTTHATPRTTGYPDRAGPGGPARSSGTPGSGRRMFVLVQAATALILYTGGNTSFNGFPFLTSYVAGDSFLPRWLLKRGHRLVFSNGIILLTVASVALLIIKKAGRQRPGAAVRHRCLHRLHHGGLRHGPVTTCAARNPAGGAGSSSTSPPGVLTVDRGGHLCGREVHRGRLAGGGALRHPGPGADPAEPRVRDGIRGARGDHRRPAAAAAALQPPHGPRVRGQLRPGHPGGPAVRAEPAAHQSLRAVHFVIDNVRAEKLREDWTRANRGVVLDFIDVPDRRLTRAAAELVGREVGESRYPRDRGAAPPQLLGRCSAGCCTTGPRTRSPRSWSAGYRVPPPRSCPMTCTAVSGCCRSGRWPRPRTRPSRRWKAVPVAPEQ